MATTREIEKAAKDAAKQAVANLTNLEENEETGEEGRVLNPEPVQGEVYDDIFTDIGEKRSKQGLFTKYSIQKNGELLCTKHHPCSWEELQRQFGGGQYRVTAKGEDGKYLRMQLKMVAQPVEEKKETEGVDFEFGDDSRPRGARADRDGIGAIELITLMQQNEERARARAREEAKESANQSNSTMQTFLTLMQTQQQATQTLMMEMQKMNMQTAEKLSAAQAAMFDKLSDRIEKISDGGNKKESGPSTFELLKMTQDAEERGFKRFQTLQELAEEKAEDKAEILNQIHEAEMKSSGKGEKKSMTDTLIETMLPTITTALIQGKAPTNQAPAPHPLTPGPTPERRALPGVHRPVQARGGTPQAQGGSRPQTANPRTAPKNSVIGPSVGARSKPAHQKVEGAISEAEFVPVTKEEIAKMSPSEIKKKIEEAVFPMIAKCLTTGKTPVQCGEQTLTLFNQMSLPLTQALAIFTKPVMMESVKSFKLPEQVNPWFEEYYAHLENAARMDTHRNSESLQPNSPSGEVGKS